MSELIFISTVVVSLVLAAGYIFGLFVHLSYLNKKSSIIDNIVCFVLSFVWPIVFMAYMCYYLYCKAVGKVPMKYMN